MLEIFLRNESLLDFMSLVHFLSGIGIGLLIIFLFKNSFKKVYFILGLFVLVVWEIFEAFLRLIEVDYYKLRSILNFLPDGWFSHESIVNIIGDMLTGFLGLLLIYLIFNHPTLKLRKLRMTKEYGVHKTKPAS